jgi:hypothetical protein
MDNIEGKINMSNKIDTKQLSSNAPEIMANCYQALVWMEENGHGNTLAAAQLRAALEMLFEARVRPDGAKFVTEVEKYELNPEDLAELRRRAEEEVSIPHEQVVARMAKLLQELEQQNTNKATA